MFHSRVAIVPTRFIVSISHLIIVILCLMGTVLSPNPYAFYFHLTFAQSGNVISGLALTYTDAEFTSTKDSLVAALIVTLICIGIGAAHGYYLPNLIARIRTSAAHSPAPDFFGLFSGVSLKINAMHAFQVRTIFIHLLPDAQGSSPQVISHFVALVLTTVFLLDNWAAGTMWYIFGFFVAPISACEALLIISSLFIGKKKY